MCSIVEYVVFECVCLILVLLNVGMLLMLGEWVFVVWNDSYELVWVLFDVLLLLCWVLVVMVMCCEVLGVVLDDFGLRMCVKLEVLSCWLMWYGVDVEVKLEVIMLDVGNVLLLCVVDLGVDLFVMGVWGWLCWLECMFGGVICILLDSMMVLVLFLY